MNPRLKKSADLISKNGCDALLVSNPLNITYLTRATGMEGYLLLIVGRIKPILFTNFLYQEAAKKIKSWDLIVSQQEEDVLEVIAKKLKQQKIQQFGFEAENLKVRHYLKLKSLLEKDKINIKATDNLIENLRIIKEPEEIKRIKASICVSEEAFRFVNEIFRGAMSEKELTIEIERFLRLKADNEIAFNPIVASGRNTAFPHHCSNQTKIGNNFFLIDLGSKYYGYCADLTRVFFWGKMPLLFKKIYNTIRKSQAVAIAKIKDGVKACDIDRAARQIIDKKGWGKYFGHGLGHGIGLAVHEQPKIGPKNSDLLKEGMVITVEPGIYLPHKFGVRIEDMVLVKGNKPEVLSGNVNR